MIYNKLEGYYKLNLSSIAQYTEQGKGLLNSGIELGSLFKKTNTNVGSYTKIIDDFKQIQDFSKHWEKDSFNWSAIAETIEGCDETALSYFKTLDNGNGTINNQAASIEGLSKHLQKAGNGFSTAALKTTLLNSALNAGIFLAASFAIQAIATGIDNYIHRVENARERTAKLFDEFSQRNDTLSAHKKVVADSADRYTQLSQGVDLSTNENRSLSTREYEGFLSIKEKLPLHPAGIQKHIMQISLSVLRRSADWQTYENI